MNVNFIRTGVLISMNLGPGGIIAAQAWSIYLLITFCFFFLPSIRPETASVALCVHHLTSLIGAADLTKYNIGVLSLATARSPCGQSRPSVVLTALIVGYMQTQFPPSVCPLCPSTPRTRRLTRARNKFDKKKKNFKNVM